MTDLPISGLPAANALDGAEIFPAVQDAETRRTTLADVAAFVTADSATAEFIRDTVAALVVAGTGITATNDDSGDTLTLATTITQYTDEMAQDAIGSMVADTATINATYTDATPELKFDVQSASITRAMLTAVANVDTIEGEIAAPADQTYVLLLKAAFPFTINELAAKTTAGTATAAVKIEGTNVTGISALSVTSTEAAGTATAANSVVAGDTVTLVLSSTSSAANLSFTLKFTRT